MNKIDHQKITKFAIDISKGVFGTKFENLLRRSGSLVVNGSKKEDDLDLDLKRIKNWHFYRNENSPYLKPFKSLIGTIHPSSRSLFAEHSTRLNQLLSKKEHTDIDKMLLLTGRIIHHIQDMSTPAHVIPVYHGPSIFPFSFPFKNDAFEKFSTKHIKNYLLATKIMITNKDHDRIEKESEKGLVELYDLVANRTLAYLESDDATFPAYVDGMPKTMGSDLFWVKYDPEHPRHDKTDGWGHYGPFGEAPKRPDVPFDTSDSRKYKGVEYTIFFADYEHIYTHLIRQMTIDALTVLRYVEKRMITKDQ